MTWRDAYDTAFEDMYQRELRAKKAEAHFRNTSSRPDAQGYCRSNVYTGFWIWERSVPFRFTDIEGREHTFDTIKNNRDGTFTAANYDSNGGKVGHETFDFGEVRFGRNAL